MLPFRAVILDWSGTLVDDLDCVLEAGNHVFRAYGKAPFSREEFREKFFLPLRDFYARYLPEVPLEELDQHFHAHYRAFRGKVTLFPEALPFLNQCRSNGLDLFLLSTIHPDHYETLAARFGLKHFFRCAMTSVGDKRTGLQTLLSRYSLLPSTTLFVGDMVHDVEAAHCAGVCSCAVLTGYDTESKLRRARPTFLCSNLVEVEALLFDTTRQSFLQF
ncbi:HAD family hydrolase [Candidatus Methylacidithermus pantelleriae]|nr:HAD family hydrolase [Candidatus Methylacidithermus pantelleriae]